MQLEHSILKQENSVHRQTMKHLIVPKSAGYHLRFEEMPFGCADVTIARVRRPRGHDRTKR